MSKDQFKILAEGNLIEDLEIKVNAKGQALAIGKLVTNPLGKSNAPHHLKTRRRTLIILVAVGKLVSALLAKKVAKGDRLSVIGTGSSRWAPTKFYSKDDGTFTTYSLIHDGKKITIGAPQLSLRVHKFDKIEQDSDVEEPVNTNAVASADDVAEEIEQRVDAAMAEGVSYDGDEVEEEEDDASVGVAVA